MLNKLSHQMKWFWFCLQLFYQTTEQTKPGNQALLEIVSALSHRHCGVPNYIDFFFPGWYQWLQSQRCVLTTYYYLANGWRKTSFPKGKDDICANLLIKGPQRKDSPIIYSPSRMLSTLTHRLNMSTVMELKGDSGTGETIVCHPVQILNMLHGTAVATA